MQLTVLDRIWVLLNSSRLLKPRPWPTEATPDGSSAMPSDCAYSATAPRVRQFQKVKLELNMALGAEHASTQSLQPSPARAPLPALELVKHPVSSSDTGGGWADPPACAAAAAAVSLSCDIMDPNEVVFSTTWNADRPNRGTKLSSSGPTSSSCTTPAEEEEEEEELAAVLVEDSDNELEVEAESGDPGPDPPPAPPESAIASEGWRPRLWDARRKWGPGSPRFLCRASVWGRKWFEKERMWLDVWIV